MTEKIMGELEIDRERGVIYFHTFDDGMIERYGTITILRVSKIHPHRLVPEKPIDLTCNDRHYTPETV